MLVRRGLGGVQNAQSLGAGMCLVPVQWVRAMLSPGRRAVVQRDPLAQSRPAEHGSMCGI